MNLKSEWVILLCLTLACAFLHEPIEEAQRAKRKLQTKPSLPGSSKEMIRQENESFSSAGKASEGSPFIWVNQSWEHHRMEIQPQPESHAGAICSNQIWDMKVLLGAFCNKKN